MLRLIEVRLFDKFIITCDGLLHRGSQNRSIVNRTLERVEIDLMRLSFDGKRIGLNISSESEFLAYFSLNSLYCRVSISLINLQHLTLDNISDLRSVLV